MLVLLDNLIRDHLVGEVPALAGPQQVVFLPPDDDLPAVVTNVGAMVLNVYLVELKENRKLRTNERETVSRNGDVFTRPRPARLECHYLMSAWSPTQPNPGVEPTLDEHALLYSAAAALFQDAPLAPSRVYPPGAPQLALWPARFRDENVPMSVLPPEGFGGVGDFWGAMGQTARWKPTLHLVATIPVELAEEFQGPMVLTRFADYRIRGQPDSAEVLIQIGGHVLDGTGAGDPVPIQGAVVNIETAAGTLVHTARTGVEGRFDFIRLTEGSYVLVTHAAGRPVLTRNVQVPAPSGEYDLVYT